MLRLAAVALAASIAVTPLALAEPQEGEPQSVRKSASLPPEVLEKIREITGLKKGDTLNLADLTPEQREQVMALLSGGGVTPAVRAPSSPVPRPPAPAGEGDDAPPRVGDLAPALSIDRYYGEPDMPEAKTLSWDDLAGNVTVLEFSATWCAPCISAIPHMNELIETFDGEPVVFLTVSNEAEAQAEKLATEHGLNGVLAWDADGSTFENFWVNGIPRVAIIDAEGRIAALTHPMLVTPEAISTVLAGQAIDLQNTHPNPVRQNWNHNGVGEEPADEVTTRAIVEPADTRSGHMMRSPKTGLIRAAGASAHVAFSTAFGGMTDDLVFEAPIPEEDYIRIDILPGDGSLETSRAMLLDGLCELYGVEAVREARTVSALALRRIDGAEVPPAGEGEGGSRFMGGQLDLPNGTMADLARMLRYAVRTPVVDETGLEGAYGVELRWDFTGGADAVGEALETYGLELVETEAEHEVLVIREAKVN